MKFPTMSTEEAVKKARALVKLSASSCSMKTNKKPSSRMVIMNTLLGIISRQHQDSLNCEYDDVGDCCICDIGFIE